MLCLLHSIKSALPHCRSCRSLERLTSMCSTFGTPSFPDFVTNSNKSLQLNWKRLINLWRQGNGLQKAEWTRNTQSRELCESWHLAILEWQVMHGAFPPKYALLVISVVLMPFYARQERDSTLSPASNVEDQRITLCLVSPLRPVQYGWPY